MAAIPSRGYSFGDDSSYYYRPGLHYSHHKLGGYRDHGNNSSHEQSLYIQHINNADDVDSKYLYAESGDEIHTKVSKILRVHNYTELTKDDINLPSPVNSYKGDDSMPIQGWVSFDHVTGRDDAESIITGIYNVASRKRSDASGIINVARIDCNQKFARAIATKVRLGNCVGVQVNIREDEDDKESIQSESVQGFLDEKSARLAFLRYKCW